MKFRKLGSAEGPSGPSSSLGIMRFFDIDVGGPKIGPEVIIGITIAFVVVILIIKLNTTA